MTYTYFILIVNRLTQLTLRLALSLVFATQCSLQTTVLSTKVAFTLYTVVDNAKKSSKNQNLLHLHAQNLIVHYMSVKKYSDTCKIGHYFLGLLSIQNFPIHS